MNVVELKDALRQLKAAVENPGLVLSNHFDELLNQVDLEYAAMLHVVSRSGRSQQICSDYSVFIARIEQFKLECISRLTAHSVESYGKQFELIESKLKLISQNSELVELKTLISHSLFELEAALFANKSLIYLNNKAISQINQKHRNLFSNQQHSIGILLTVTDEYFDRDTINSLLGQKLLLNTRGSLKASYLFEALRRQSIDTSTPCVTLDLKSIKEIDLKFKSLTHLDKYIFHDMPNLKAINLSYNHLVALDKDLLRGLTHLTTLDLSHNKLTDLHKDLFNNLSNLTEIHLYDNSIASLHKDQFEGLSSLATINLFNNKLTFLHKDLFRGLVNLLSINLFYNQINSIEKSTFQGLNKLNDVKLNYNKLDSLHGDTFQQLPNLKLVDLRHNNFTLLFKVKHLVQRQPFNQLVYWLLKIYIYMFFLSSLFKHRLF